MEQNNNAIVNEETTENSNTVVAKETTKETTKETVKKPRKKKSEPTVEETTNEQENIESKEENNEIEPGQTYQVEKLTAKKNLLNFLLNSSEYSGSIEKITNDNLKYLLEKQHQQHNQNDFIDKLIEDAKTETIRKNIEELFDRYEEAKKSNQNIEEPVHQHAKTKVEELLELMDKRNAERKEEEKQLSELIEKVEKQKTKEIEEKKKAEFNSAMTNVFRNIPPITTNKTGYSSNGKEYSYADLTSVMEHTRKILADNNLSVEFRQKISVKNSTLKVKLLVHHENGYTYSSDTVKVPVEVNNIQKIASALTYIKRYLYSSMFTTCSVENDDDGSIASNTNQPKPLQLPQQTKQPVRTNQQFPSKPVPPQIPTKQVKKETVCSKCGTKISEKEYSYSMRAFNKPICFDCQQKG